MADSVAKFILEKYPVFMGEDAIIITLISGYDIGIASSFIRYTVAHSPERWMKRLGIDTKKE